MKKRMFPALLVLVLAMSLLSPFASAAGEAAGEPVTINVYNWGMYIADGSDGSLDVNAAFTEATGIQVNYMTYDSNESLYTRLKTGGANYDVIIPSDYMIGRMIAEDMLEPLDFDKIPNYQNVDDSFKNQPYDPENAYSVPYAWGTVGLIYNTKYVTQKDVSSWDLLWDQDYAGKILMFDNPRDSFAIAEALLGYDANTEDPDELQAAADKLKEQKPLVQSYVMDEIFSAMEREAAWVAPYYAGDYLTMAEENENLAFCLPDEGFNLFVDAMCIPKGAEHKDAAEAYINFLCSPEISGRNMDYLSYSTPISAAKDYMDPDLATSPIAYPDAATLARSTSFLNLSDETNQQMEALWLSVKTGEASGSNNNMLAIGGGILLVMVVVLVLLNLNSKKKKIARCKSGQ